jgi:hypothetical protein
MSDPSLWFAVRNVRRSVAYALDACPDELKPYETVPEEPRA